MGYYVYMLECSDGSYYIGVTNDLWRRISEHQQGLDPDCYTYRKRPISLKNYKEFEYVYDAINTEKKLKKWSRAKKEAFFKNDWQSLHEKAKCMNASAHSSRDNKP